MDRVWKNGECLAVLQGHRGRGVWRMALLPGLKLATAGADGSIKIWPLAQHLPAHALADISGTRSSVAPMPIPLQNGAEVPAEGDSIPSSPASPPDMQNGSTEESAAGRSSDRSSANEQQLERFTLQNNAAPPASSGRQPAIAKSRRKPPGKAEESLHIC